jgi:hypothetical protein
MHRLQFSQKLDAFDAYYQTLWNAVSNIEVKRMQKVMVVNQLSKRQEDDSANPAVFALSLIQFNPIESMICLDNINSCVVPTQDKHRATVKRAMSHR